MNKQLSRILQILIPLALGIVLVWYFYSKFTPEQWTELKYHFTHAHYGFVVIAVLMSAFSHVIRAHRWRLLLQPLGFHPGLLNSFLAVSVAYLANLFIPKSGEVSRAIILDKYEKVPFEQGFGTVISERIVDLIFLFAFTGLALGLQYQELYDYINGIFPFKKVLWASILGMVALVVFFLFLKYSKGPLFQKIKGFLLGLKEGVLSILKMKQKVVFLFYSFAIWLLYFASFYTATQALPETSVIGFGTLVITFVVGSFTFAFTNSGVGYYPLAIAGILFIFGIPETVGTALGWIVWTSNILYIILFGVLSLMLLPLLNKVAKR